MASEQSYSHLKCEAMTLLTDCQVTTGIYTVGHN